MIRATLPGFDREDSFHSHFLRLKIHTMHPATTIRTPQKMG